MASVHLEEGGGQVRRRRVAFQRAPGWNPESGWANGQEPLELLSSQEASAQGGFPSLCRAGDRPAALRGDAFSHSLLLILSPVARVVRAATATATATATTTASVLLGQQALPLGFVVCEMA